ncbi:MAG: AAC(3) family N-acetyltransferase [Bacteroidales bacterium]|jgi:aminoglycoside 3-N-acetyltransferase
MSIIQTSIQQFEELLWNLGVRPNETLMVHSSLFSLGIFENGVEGFHKALTNSVGEFGNIVVPTFTWSFRKGQIFDVLNSAVPKEIGTYPEYFRKLPGAVRSLDPLFSMAAIGPNADELMQRSSKFCFGRGSIYEKLFAINMRILAIGITYSTGVSPFMHLERLAGVDYRKEQRFDGITIDYQSNRYDDWAIHFARNQNKYPEVRTFRESIGREMEKIGISKSQTYGYGRHFAIEAKLFEEYILSVLKSNPFAMLVKDSNEYNRLYNIYFNN